jgi:hypothetical protein
MPARPSLAWTLRSVARIERNAGIRPPRLTEPSLERWARRIVGLSTPANERLAADVGGEVRWA